MYERSLRDTEQEFLAVYEVYRVNNSYVKSYMATSIFLQRTS